MAKFDITIRTMRGCTACSNIGYTLRFDPDGEDERLDMVRCRRCAGRSAEVEFFMSQTNGCAYWIRWPTEMVTAWMRHSFNL